MPTILVGEGGVANGTHEDNMRLGSLPISLIGAAALLATPACAQTFTQWSGNGHFYGIVLPGVPINWGAARLDALARGGYVATLTSEAENAFVANLADSPIYWREGGSFGPWIGLYHEDGVEPHATGWKWVTGETTTYTNWSSDAPEPNNVGGHENYAHLYSLGDGRHDTWNDLGDNDPACPISYVLEVDAVPEPTTMIAMGLGLATLARRKLCFRKASSSPDRENTQT